MEDDFNLSEWKKKVLNCHDRPWFRHHILPQVYDESLSYEEQISKLFAQFCELVKKFNELQDAFEELLIEWEIMKQEWEQWKSRLEAVENQLKEILQELISINNKIENIETTLETVQNDIDNIKNELNTISNKITNLENNYNELNEKVNNLEIIVNGLLDRGDVVLKDVTRLGILPNQDVCYNWPEWEENVYFYFPTGTYHMNKTTVNVQNAGVVNGGRIINCQENLLTLTKENFYFSGGTLEMHRVGNLPNTFVYAKDNSANWKLESCDVDLTNASTNDTFCEYTGFSESNWEKVVLTGNTPNTITGVKISNASTNEDLPSLVPTKTTFDYCDFNGIETPFLAGLSNVTSDGHGLIRDKLCVSVYMNGCNFRNCGNLVFRAAKIVMEECGFLGSNTIVVLDFTDDGQCVYPQSNYSMRLNNVTFFRPHNMTNDSSPIKTIVSVANVKPYIFYVRDCDLTVEQPNGYPYNFVNSNGNGLILTNIYYGFGNYPYNKLTNNNNITEIGTQITSGR